jgi:hypothetical protein
MLEYFAPVPGGLSFQVGGQNFGPIGLYQTEQAALAGVGASAAPLQVFWLLGQANVQVWRGDPLHGVPFSVVQDIGSPGLAPYVAPVLTIPVVAG